ncbi:carboxymuconolactone decarboxylase family protein [Vagococcus luciliae]|uniref:Carboxymuconolactone decarboxylase-like domain-containing protein n=1 Tax=Vagococcus luciliae TaxID=2920380 RepID=A0ABY5P1J3_9ENTE|nr:carboxymuconolactone decarboxylase family protein [Vagococcus luciliae]UUV99799.1 hypothetical protein G314FT_19680 [Vagococcus luciliae]
MLIEKELASFSERYKRLYYAFRNIPNWRRSLKKGVLSEHFNSRIMLAVTEVNGCTVCSYGHTTMALESGMSQSEINELLGGGMTEVPLDEQMAILFAQHVADNRGKVSIKSWDNLVKEYGIALSEAILSSTQIILMGNTFGIPIGSFLSRITTKEAFKKDNRSTTYYELGVILSLIGMLPVAFIHSIIAGVVKLPLADCY